ncbi:zinc metallohydrolase, glyoxalase ii family [hydrocarbon metagenome]|uniref:Zinc metallohydrolase, glyoxalase ii family n=1 Tax=hydrocarbon metagenome TaxID=938273 RepID=A0A0W8E7A4_9ZZZZ
MRLKKITGRTFAIDYPSAVGVYVLEDKSCILIDSGASEVYGRRTLKILEARGWHVVAIVNTHAHGDHSGGNKHIQDTAGCRIYASPMEAAYLNNPVLAAYSLYHSVSMQALKSKFYTVPLGTINNSMDNDCLELQGEKFKVWNIPGHSLGHIGIETPDKVLFAGDSLIEERIIFRHSFPHLEDVESQFRSLELLKESEMIYLSHGGLVENNDRIIASNHELITNNLALVEKVVKEVCSREEIIRKLADNHVFAVKENNYFRLMTTTAAYLAFLHNNGRVGLAVQDGRLVFYPNN